MTITTKSIYSLALNESTVLCIDDIEYKELKTLSKDFYEWFKDNTLSGNGRALVTKIK